jgi:hypothetical protein
MNLDLDAIASGLSRLFIATKREVFRDVQKLSEGYGPRVSGAAYFAVIGFLTAGLSGSFAIEAQTITVNSVTQGISAYGYAQDILIPCGTPPESLSEASNSVGPFSGSVAITYVGPTTPDPSLCFPPFTLSGDSLSGINSNVSLQGNVLAVSSNGNAAFSLQTPSGYGGRDWGNWGGLAVTLVNFTIDSPFAYSIGGRTSANAISQWELQNGSSHYASIYLGANVGSPVVFSLGRGSGQFQNGSSGAQSGVLPPGSYLFLTETESDAFGQTGFSNFLESGRYDSQFTLYPCSPCGSLRSVNPYALFVPSMSAPSAVTLSTVQNSPPARMLAADGKSAVVLMYQSQSQDPVTFSISAMGQTPPAGKSLGYLAPFDPNFLDSGPPPSLSNPVGPYSCDEFNNCTFLALLWSPDTFPFPDSSPPAAAVEVSVTQDGSTQAVGIVQLVPPALLLVHGLWDSAAGAGFAPGTGGFYDWIASQYPHSQIFGVNYGFGPPACLTCTPAIFPFPAELLSAKRFDDAQIQAVFANAVDNALASAANAGLAARTVDVVAHSMGGLVARQYESSSGYSENPALLGNPIHSLITIGTPHLGTNLATTLWNDQPQTLVNQNPLVQGICFLASGCINLGEVFDLTGHTVDSAVASLSPGSTQISNLSSSSFDAVVGEAPTNPLSTTESTLNAIIGAFLPNQTVNSILGGQASDTIVPVGSASAGSADCAAVPGIVHAAMGAPDTGETKSGAVWVQAFHWLTGGSGLGSRSIACPTTALSAQSHNVQSHKTAGTKPHPGDIGLSTGSAPNLNLAGYTQVDVSNVAITPASGSALTIGSATIISASSTTKTIAEMLLLQGVIGPTDTVLMYATQSPFTITYTPTRLGTASFTAITVFNDNTYALTPVSYSLQAPSPPLVLYFLNAPIASIPISTSTVIEIEAQFPSGPADVTNVATYASQSGGASVFGIGAGGTITANGPGVDQLNVSYGGLTATATIAVGACTYALTPSSQIVSYSGGKVTIGVTAPTGCAWTATGGAAWLTFVTASGVGNGTISLSAAANTTGLAQSATINVGNTNVLLEQPAISCTYSVNPSQISAPPPGVSGTINVATSCPITVSSNAIWLTAAANNGTVAYTVTPNTGASARTATLTIGTQVVAVMQSSAITPTETVSLPTASITTAQPLTVSVTVNGGAGNPTPTGSVTLTSAALTTSPAALSNGSAVINVSAGSLAVGTDTLTVLYIPDSADSSFYSDASASATVVVTAIAKIVPALAITPSTSNVSTSQPLSVTIAVSGGSGNPVPTGTATLTSGSFTSPAVSLSAGTATIDVPAGSLAVGSDTLTANYTPDSNSSSIYMSATGTSAPVTVTQTRSIPTVTVTPSSNNITTAQSLMVTVAVSGGTGNPTPTGSATLSGGGYTSSAGALLGGSYTFAVPASSLSVGTDALTVTYSGDTNYTANTGTASVTVTTSPLTPTVNVTPVASSLDSGTVLSVTAVVTGAGVTPTGTVTLSGGGYTSSAGTLSGGSYIFALPANSLTAGTDTLTVSYSGDSIYTAGTGSASVSVTQSAFSLAASAPPAVKAGSTATSTVTVSTTTGYAGTVTISCALTSSPAGAAHLPTCSNGSSTVALSGTTTTGTATVTVSTTAPTTSMSRPGASGGRGLAGAGGGAILALLVFLGTPARRRNWRSLMSFLVVMLALGGTAGCGGGGAGGSSGGGGTTTPGTTAGVYTFTVTGSGSPGVTPTPTSTFTLTVN